MYDRILDLLQDNKKIEDALPANAGVAIIECLQKQKPEVPVEASILALYSKVAQVLSIDRVLVNSKMHVKGDVKGVFPNIYGLLFLQSSGGKDYITDTINRDFLHNIESDFRERYLERKREYIQQLEVDANIEVGKSKAEIAKYIAARMPFEPNFENNGGTSAALITYREHLQALGIGGIFYRNPEFADYLESKNEENKEFLKIMKEGYEGDTGVQMRKGERSKKAVRGVPMSMLVHTDDYNFLNNEYKKNEVLTFFNRGYARRMITCVAKPNKIEYGGDIEVQATIERENNRLAKEATSVVLKAFNDMYNEVRNINAVYTLSDESDMLLLEYKMYLSNQIDHMPIEDTHVIKEVSSRFWKALKLSCIISAFEMPSEQTIDVNFVESAIKIIEFYGNNYKSFFELKQDSQHATLLTFFKKNEGKWLKTADIRDGVDIGWNKFSAWFKENYGLVVEKLEGTGYSIQEEPLVPRGMKYRLISQKTLEQEELDKLPEMQEHVKQRLDGRTTGV